VGSHRRKAARPRLVAGSVVALVGLALVALVVWVRSGSDGTGAAPSATAAASVASPPEPAPPGGIVDRAACPPTVVACVDLRTDQSWLQRDGAVVYGPVHFRPGAQTGLVPPGPTSSATPTGTFHVQRKKADEVSREFGEPMPHAVYFAPGGIAFHQGSLEDSSHGCVHLTAADATAYFDQLKIGDPVLVFS
jgi:hypothetical protein